MDTVHKSEIDAVLPNMRKSHIVGVTSDALNPQELAAELAADFCDILNLRWTPPLDLQAAVRRMLEQLTPGTTAPIASRRTALFRHINSKLQLSRARLKTFLDAAATVGVFPDYHQKARILWLLDESNMQGASQYFEDVCWPQSL